MTKDEAELKLKEATRSSCTETFMIDFLDCAVALGLLELDEPKDVCERALDVLSDGKGCVAISYYGASICIEKLNAAGLKIVEK